MDDVFGRILNWKLLKGSHDFPGPDGGTCINEAAVVAAGLPYREIKSVDDMPACFSPVLSMYALGLNDIFGDDARQRLMPLVVTLSGSRGTVVEERTRAEHILLQTLRLILPDILHDKNVSSEAVDEIRAVSTLHAAYAGMGRVLADPVFSPNVHGAPIVRTVLLRQDLDALISSAILILSADHSTPFAESDLALRCARLIRPCHHPRHTQSAFRILDEALDLGPGGNVDPGIAEGRLAAARARYQAPQPA